MQRLRFGWLPSLVVGVVVLGALDVPAARAYTTRIHIVLANQLREELIASGDGSIRLRHSDYSVRLRPEDVMAIEAHPLAFRAGAIGPDNIVFPAMTDLSHGAEQDPFTQCQLLYDDAFTDEERAYAIGCFVHGASDAVAHHFVNAMTGETFTLNPITSARENSFSNVVRHIVMEDMIQDAVLATDPAALGTTSLQHEIPDSFVLRNYLDVDAPVWQLVARHAVAKVEAERAGRPGDSFSRVAIGTSLAPVEFLALAPRFVDDIQAEREGLRTLLADEIADMQDWASARGSQLLVEPGPDGMLSTRDDVTDCSVSCPLLFATYHTYVRLLLPRRDAGGRELPAAFDVVSTKLGDDLNLLLPALVQTIEGFSARLNTGVTAPDAGLGISATDVSTLFAPLRDWSTTISTIDYETIARALAPEWYTEITDFLSRAGVDVSFANVIEAFFAPVLDAVRDVIRVYVIEQAQNYLDQFLTDYRSSRDSTRAEFEMRIADAAPNGLGETALDAIYDSGLWAHSFNLAAATIADHRVLLPESDDPIADGPTSFDASYTPDWSQAGLCGYLRAAIFPLGTDVRGSLSVRSGGTDYAARLDQNSPIECHDGSLSAFGAPSASSCAFVHLGDLIMDPAHRGSLSRAYPPDYASGAPACRNLDIEGLPDPPPPGTDAGPGGGVDSGPGGGRDAGPGGGGGGSDDGGCGCAVPARRISTPIPLLLLAVGLLAAVRRRRRAIGASLAVFLAAAVVASGCGDDDGPSGDEDAGPIDVDSGPSGEDSGPPGSDAGTPEDSGPADVDAGPDPRRVLIERLGDSTWSALQTRTEGVDLVERAYEITFRASALQWAEVRNPFGPARRRRMRSFNVMRDGTVESLIMNVAGWPPDPDNGRRETWTFEIVDGSPRQLRITDSTGATETFREEPWPAPTDGLTAEVRSFSSGGVVDRAFCTEVSDGFEREVIWDFARGMSAEPAIGYDVVAGSRLGSWRDSASGPFSVTDVDGFDRLGRTAVTTSTNFVVRYTGVIRHPGGELRVREADDAVEDALWIFGDTMVGSRFSTDLLLEVHGYFTTKATGDEGVITSSPRDIPIELILIRCTATLGLDRDAIDAQINLGGAGWTLFGMAPSTPEINDALFPPAL